jgi:hypothetical protein
LNYDFSGRHPCVGVKIAKLKIKMIVALFFTGYEYDVVDVHGNPVDRLPVPNYNDIHQVCPLFRSRDIVESSGWAELCFDRHGHLESPATSSLSAS